MAKLNLTGEEFATRLGFQNWLALTRASIDLTPQGEDVSWFVTPLPSGEWIAWDDQELALDRVSRFATRSEAVEHHIAGAIADYEIQHDDMIREMGLEVVIDRCYDGDGDDVIGFRLSLDSDGSSHGCDERFGAWGQ